MNSRVSNKKTPPKGENQKLKEKSEAFSDVTHVSQRSYQFNSASTVKVAHSLLSISTSTSSRAPPATSPKPTITSNA